MGVETIWEVRVAFTPRQWVDREVVTAAKLNDLESRVNTGMGSVVAEVGDPDVAALVADQYSTTTAALKTRVQGWVADGTIPAGGGASGPVSVTETQPGVYEVSGLQVVETSAGVYEIGV